MGKYQLHAFCDECGETHFIDITIQLDEGPSKKEKIVDTFTNKQIPQEITALISSSKISCQHTGVTTSLKGYNQVFLVPERRKQIPMQSQRGHPLEGTLSRANLSLPQKPFFFLRCGKHKPNLSQSYKSYTASAISYF